VRTLVVSQDAMDAVTSKLRGVLRAHVDSQGPVTTTFDKADTALFQVNPEIVVVVLSPDVERGLEMLRKLRREITGFLLAAGQASESKLILRALQGGADHYLDEAELETGLKAVMARLQIKQEATAPPGKLIALLAASGGSGASSLAVNIAVLLAKDFGKCALLDMKPGIGDLAALLDLKPQFNLADLCLNVSRLDRAMFEKMLTQHPCGVSLLASPQAFGDARVITAQGVNQALTMGRKLFPYVVADMEDCFHEEQIATLRQATNVMLVFRLDFTSLRNARRILGHLRDLDIPRARIRLVANRFGQPYELPVAEAEQALGETLSHFVPDDPKTFNRCNNSGIPVVLKAPLAKVSKSIEEVAQIAIQRGKDEGVPSANGAAHSPANAAS
jgi:pilus assembly protein CpaE